ncbi:TIGR04066 family peptide maturation system protein [Paenibacillus sp. FSL P2-0173]|uniref:TIGR04066 family peptide maturation system protein n=1 Tax=Paenibacillus sp. FSL P2-0173 TaxID=2921627 RepID=UPI0030F694EB
MTNKLIIFPFDYETIALVRNLNLLGSYEEVVLISFQGSGMIGKDACVTDKGEVTGFIVKPESCLEQEMERCDAILLVKSNFKLDVAEVYLPVIQKAGQLGKKVMCNFTLPDSCMEFIEPCEEQADKLILKNTFDVRTKDILPPDPGSVIHDFFTPVLFVLGLNERTHKLNLQLNLRQKLEAQGYRVSQITSNGCGELIGAHSFPQFMFESGMTETQKIIMFNRYLKKIEQSEKPDLILVGIPGGIVPFNNTFTNYFGVTSFLVSRAVRADGLICCLHYDEYNIKYLEHVKQYMENRFSSSLLGYAICNNVFDSYSSSTVNMQYASVDHRFVEEKKQEFSNYSVPVLHLSNDEDMNRLTQDILHYFSVDHHVVQL